MRMMAFRGVLLILFAGGAADADVLRDAQALFLAGDRAGARDLLEQQIGKSPDDVDLHLTYAFVRGSLGERDQVRAHYLEKLKNDPQNRIYLVTLLSVSPPSPFVARSYERLLEGNPDFVPGWEEWGRHYLTNWKPAEAVAPLEQAVALSPKRTKSLLYLGLAHRTLGNLTKEITYLSRAFQADSLDPQVRVEWAFTILDRGDPNLALKVLAPVLESWIDDDYPFVLAAVAHARLGDEDSFRLRKRQAAERNPDMLEDILYRGIRFRNIENGREAERMFRIALALEPEYEDAAVQLGIHHLSHARYADARTVFERLVRTSDGKGKAIYWKYLGDCAAGMGDNEAAAGHFEKASGIDPDFVGARVGRARILTELGRYEEAADEWVRIITIDPRSWMAKVGREAVVHLRKGETPPAFETRNERIKAPATAR